MRMIVGTIMMIIDHLVFVLFCGRSAASKTVPTESQACRDHGALLSNEGGTFEAKS